MSTLHVYLPVLALCRLVLHLYVVDEFGPLDLQRLRIEVCSEQGDLLVDALRGDLLIGKPRLGFDLGNLGLHLRRLYAGLVRLGLLLRDFSLCLAHFGILRHHLGLLCRVNGLFALYGLLNQLHELRQFTRLSGLLEVLGVHRAEL